MFVEIEPGHAIYELLDVAIPLGWSHDCDLMAGVNHELGLGSVAFCSYDDGPGREGGDFPDAIRNTSKPVIGVRVQGSTIAWVGRDEAEIVFAIKSVLMAELAGVPTPGAV